jgi:toxin-antitoxin system PIN domain toxin
VLTYLLDVNVLIGLIDSTHVSHQAVHVWFAADGRHSWATCPTTENGVLRIVSHPAYPNRQASPAAVAAVLRRLRELPGHVFWPDDISLLDSNQIEPGHLLTHKQVTDSYLLALAADRGARLATLDRRLSADAVEGGAAALHHI